MTLEEKIKIIEEKIANLPSDFDVEERHIINNNQRLIDLIHQTILNNPHLINEEVFGCLTDEVKNSLLEKYGDKVYYHYIDNALKVTIPAMVNLNNYLAELPLNEETQEHFRKIVKEAFENKDMPLDRFDMGEETIKEMIRYKRFDLISQVNNVSLEEETLDELWQIYPFEEYKFPRLFANNISFASKYIDKFPLEESIIAYIKLTNDASYKTTEELESICSMLPTYLNVLKEKLNGIENLNLEFLFENQYFFQTLLPNAQITNLVSQSTKDDMLEIAVKLSKLGLYDISSELFNKNLITQEELRNIVIKVARSNDIKKFENLNFSSFVETYKEDKELATILLENGFVEEASLVSTDFIKEKADYIIEQLNNKNIKFKEFAKTVVYDGNKSSDKQFDIYLAILNTGFVEEISTGNFNIFSEEEIEELKYILTHYPNIRFNPYKMNENEFLKILNTLEETKRTNAIISFIKGTYYPEDIELLREINKTGILNKIISTNFTDGLELLRKKIKTIIEIPEIFDEYLKNEIYIDIIIDQVNHNEDLYSFYSVENYNKVKNYLSKRYNIPLTNLDRLQERFGPLIIRYIENENIQTLTKLSNDEQDKIFALFPKVDFNFQDLGGVYDSLKQYEFSKKCSSDVQIFPTLLHAIEDQNHELIESLIKKLASELDESFFEKFINKYELPEVFNKDNMIELVNFVVEKIKITTGEKLEKYHAILHEMTDYYISKKREEYRTTYHMEDELRIPYKFDEKSLENVMTRYIIMESPQINTRFRIDDFGISVDFPESFMPKTFAENFSFYGFGNQRFCYTLAEYLVIEMMNNGVDKELAKETFMYYVTKDKTICKDFKQVQKTIPILIKTTKDTINKIPNLHSINQYGINRVHMESLLEQADSKKEIKRIYQVSSESNLLDIITQLNIPTLQKGVLSNPKVYESLLQTMNKRKLHVLPNELSNILGTEFINISPDLTNIAGFISYYGSIYNNVKSNLEANGKSSEKILLNITNILIYAEVYSGISSVYSQILGGEDSKLIKANPGPNSATKNLANDGRLKEAVERTKKLYERQEITIPPFEDDVTVGENKKMHVVVGNFTHPSNLTHGERTGACMRIGGVGESLFEFALDNPNGFHIRFEDPVTHEYISRVTGFRNGNTVFLNELRDSCNKNKYDNNDVINACTKTAERLIELSRKSSCPIENVVVHRAYATINMNAKMEHLGVSNIKEGLPEFYSDVGTSAIILATSATSGKFVPLNFNKNNVPTYQPLREKPKEVKTLQEASNKINRINSVKKLLAGENYEYIEPYQFQNGLIYAIVSEDWYIYVDEIGNINHDFIAIDPRAKEELSQALAEVQKNISKIKEENSEVKYGL